MTPDSAAPGGGDVYLSASGVTKTFGGSKALDNVSLDLRKGMVHALVGANGAGKSTLARIIAGHLRPDSAAITLGGAPLRIATPRAAIERGIAMVTQQLSLAGDLTAAENIMLTEMAKPGLLDKRCLREQAAALLHSVNPDGGIDPAAPVKRLSSAHRQMVEIAKAMSQDPSIIIFDEPTTSLTPFETERLFAVMEKLKRQGRALVFVSHRMEEIFAICDVVTVLRDGKNVCAATELATLDQAGLIRLIIGRELGDIYGGRPAGRSGAAGTDADADEGGAAVLEARHLHAPPAVEDVSFTLRRGEILGLAGLVGAGRTETARIVFGLDPMRGGEVLLRGKPYRNATPGKSYRLGMAMIPEDRKKQGSIPDFTVLENIMIGRSAAFPGIGTGYRRLQSAVRGVIRGLNLESRHLGKLILQLSGGMQQKAMLSRALLVDPEILILDEPTQGVDVGTRSDIYAILRRLAARGLALLLISSDFEEVLGVADRVVVLAEGRSVAEFDAGLMDEEKLTMFAAPRTSAGSTHKLLGDIVARWPRSCGYWVYFGQGRVFCFDSRGDAAGTGFAGGSVAECGDTCLLPFAGGGAGGPGGPGGEGEIRKAGSVESILAARTNARGQNLGYIGVTAPAGTFGPGDAGEFARMVEQWSGEQTS